MYFSQNWVLFMSNIKSLRIFSHKFFCLSLIFFSLIASYTIIKELQSSVFMRTVGKDYLPTAKVLSFLFMIPLVIFYSHLVDKLKNYQLLSTVLLFYALISCLLSVFIGTNIGLLNEEINPHRFFGWIFYFFVEGYPAFLISTFWAFSNSSNTPQEAEGTYSFLVSSSKLGGMSSAAFSYILTKNYILKNLLAHEKIQILMIMSSIFLGIGVLAALSMKDKYQKNSYTKKIKEESNTSLFEGLRLLNKKYVFCIFMMLFCFEVINQILNFQRLIYSDNSSGGIDALNAMLYEQVFIMQFIGFFVASCGTSFVIRYLGVRKSLFVVPLIVTILVAIFAITKQAHMLIASYIITHVLSYAFIAPLRENLYVITSRDIQFKAKSWIESVGMKSSKMTGQMMNIISRSIASSSAAASNNFTSTIFAISLAAWFYTANFLGKEYNQKIKDHQIIA